PTLYIVNNQSINLTAKLDTNGLTICVNGVKIKTDFLDIPTHITATQTSIDSLMRTMKEMVLCRGMQRSLVGDLRKDSYVEEQWRNIKDNTIETRVRTRTCQLVVAWMSKKGICERCMQHFRKRRSCNERETTEASTPISVPPDPHIRDEIRDETDNANKIEKQDVESIDVSEEDHKQLLHLLENVLKSGAPAEFQSMLYSQLKNMDTNKDPRFRRWSKDVIRVCLSIFCR
ncbi:MAG: hypothetical protein ABW185_02610, partial [Sedimenticola sp.]